MTPKLDYGFVSFSDEDKEIIKEHGLCVFCDFQKTCQINTHKLSVMSAWKEHGDHIEIVVKTCSKHQFKNVKTFGVRRSD